MRGVGSRSGSSSGIGRHCGDGEDPPPRPPAPAEWIARVVIALPEFLDAIAIEPDCKEEAKRSIGLIHEELGMGFQALRDLERLTAQQDAPELELLRAYTDLYDHLWRAYKDRFPKLPLALGYDIGFLFQKQATFEAGLGRFMKENPALPDDFAAMLTRDRAGWQSGLALFRNEVLQHRRTVDPRLAQALLQSDSARAIFENVAGAPVGIRARRDPGRRARPFVPPTLPVCAHDANRAEPAVVTGRLKVDRRARMSP